MKPDHEAESGKEEWETIPPDTGFGYIKIEGKDSVPKVLGCRRPELD
jgi:hypothetical protein